MKTIFTTLFLTICLNFFSQNIVLTELTPTQVQENNTNTYKNYPAENGTYQFIFKTRDTKKEIKLSDDELIKLENLRHPSYSIYVKVSEGVVIRLYSANDISSSLFVEKRKNTPLYFNEINPEEFDNINIFKQATSIK